MDIKFISQYAGDNAHYSVLEALLKEDTFNSFRSLNAFVTLGGLFMIDDSLVDFLRKGNSINWIIGIDNGITSKEAIEYLKGLHERFNSQVQVKIFTSGSNHHIFHPKAYCLENENECVIIIGSANNTEGGLLGNFELSMLARFNKSDTNGLSAYKEFETIWTQYSAPKPPLTEANLLDLMSEEVNKLLEKMEVEGAKETGKSSQKRTPHPLSETNKGNEIRKKIRELHGSKTGSRKRKVNDTEEGTEVILVGEDTEDVTEKSLIMDILTETRLTQVQFPLKGARIFFAGVSDMKLYYRENDKITFEGDRPIVNLTHNSTLRVELKKIKDFPRPLIMRMSPVPGDINNYVYELIDSTHAEFETLDNLLRNHGEQSRPTSRRWIIS